MKDSSPPRPTRANLLRVAGDILGSEELARRLHVSSRKGYQLMAGSSPVHDLALERVASALIEQRQRIAMLLALIRREQGR